MNKEITQYQFISDLKSLDFIDEIWLFGSRARGDHQTYSDIDLAIVCPHATDRDWQDLIHLLERADTLLKVDCIRLEKGHMNDELYVNIVRHKKVLYKKMYWKDSFYTLGKAIDRLQDALELPPNDYIRDAVIQRFEFTIELFWKVLKKILFYEKIESTTPRDVLSKAYQYQLIGAEDMWLKMLDDRNNTSHAYKEAEAKRIFENIKLYLPVFEATYETLKKKYDL